MHEVTPVITVTTADRERVRELLLREHARRSGAALHNAARMLEQALEEALIVTPTEVSRRTATLNSRVMFSYSQPYPGRPADKMYVSTVTLVQPQDADPMLGRESVLSPIGSALFGLSEGDSLDWPNASGETARYTLLRVISQPEADGRFDL